MRRQGQAVSSAKGEYVARNHRRRVTLPSSRFAMIDDGVGFELVPSRPALARQAFEWHDAINLPLHIGSHKHSHRLRPTTSAAP